MVSRAGYEPLAQSEEGNLEEGDVGLHHSEQQTTQRRLRRPQIDLRTIDTAFKKWTENITQKMKRKKKRESALQKVPIMHSVFGPEVKPPPNYMTVIHTLDHGPPMSHEGYNAVTEAVREAISEGVHPKMISKGSSGSYFARVKLDGKVQTVGVFKPKDEEPYGRLNPKTTKWIHRQLRWIIPFGRSCLIPNLSYISEAAASLLDTRLHLHIVPKTELVTFSSPAFFYDWLDRNAAKKGKPLPGKIGSMQLFMHGYQDASDFLRTHPLPGRSISDTFDDSSHRTGGATKRFLSVFQVLCGRTGAEGLNEDDEDDDDMYIRQPSQDAFHWTKLLQQDFKEELEKLVILDFLMRNTDRGADNYMIKYCEGSHERPLVDIAPSRSSMSIMPTMMRELSTPDPRAASSSSSSLPRQPTPANEGAPQYAPRGPHIHIAAIDNSLAFPHEHPKGWRSYTYGWLYLPVSVIGRPFSTQTRNHFLPILTSKAWWEETTYELKKLFSLDPDFHPKMFKRQLAVMKGQAWNIVQCLKHSDEGPLELTRRQKVLIWDDEVEISEDEYLAKTFPMSTSAPAMSPQHARRQATERRMRSRSMEGYPFPPPMRRSMTDSIAGRPVPFAGKFQQINPGASGVRVLEQMERLDEVEKGLKKLGMEEVVEEEDDVGVIGGEEEHAQDPDQGDVGATSKTNLLDQTSDNEDHNEALSSSIISAPVLFHEPLSDADADGDLYDDHARNGRPIVHGRGASERIRRSLDWTRSSIPETPIAAKTRTVIMERLEVIKTSSLFSC